MYDVEYIRQQMRLLRANRGLKQNMVAERMGISPAFYNMLEKGKKNISVEHMKSFSKAVDVPVESLLPEDTNMEEFFDYSELTDMDKKLLEIIMSLSPEEKERVYNQKDVVHLSEYCLTNGLFFYFSDIYCQRHFLYLSSPNFLKQERSKEKI